MAKVPGLKEMEPQDVSHYCMISKHFYVRKQCSSGFLKTLILFRSHQPNHVCIRTHTEGRLSYLFHQPSRMGVGVTPLASLSMEYLQSLLCR